MKRFVDLSNDDRMRLLRYPVYISLLASTAGTGLDDIEMKSVLKLTHIKTFAGNPLVADFYREAEKWFSNILVEVDEELPKDKTQRAIAINHELDKMELILKKLPPQYADALVHSMRMYAHHVSKAHYSVLGYFIFPMPIKGLSE